MAVKRIGRKILFLLLIGAVGVAVFSVVHRFAHKKTAKPIERGSIRIQVLNGSGVDREGKRAANFLRGLGFDVWDIKDATQLFDKTKILEHTDKNRLHGLEVARVLKCREKVGIELDSLLYLDVTVIVGKDYKRFFPDTGQVF
jgi:hypothetical protein